MLHKPKATRIFYIFLCILTLVNLLQGYSTELILDESYYWYFSRKLEWGYFDHPPMIAFLVKIGYSLFNNELGIRFFSAFLFSGTVYLIWLLIEDTVKYREVILFCILTSSVALFNVYGFFMLPDTPLLFFAALFLFGYKKFLEKENYIAIVLLAVSMAGMMYSKYHAVLFIGFIILSNLRLLLKWKFIGAGVLALILYLPHILWLADNNFASIRYHLVERANSTYKIQYTLDYIVGFIAVPGLAFPLIFIALFKHKVKNILDKGLVLLVYGIFVFFLISSFNRRTQAQWTLLTLIPLIIISFRHALHHKKFRKWLLISSSATLVILSFLRFAIVFENISPIVYESHGNKEWVETLKEQSNGRPVAFRNSYTEASMYTYYSGIEAISINGYPFRQNQFDIDSSEYKFRHKNAVYVSSRKDADSTFGYIRKFRNLKWKGIFMDDFQSWRKLKVILDKTALNTKKDSISLKIINPYNEDIPFNQLSLYGLTLTPKKAAIDTLPVNIPNYLQFKSIPSLDTLTIKCQMEDWDKLEKASFFRITIRENNLPMGFQGNIIKLNN